MKYNLPYPDVTRRNAVNSYFLRRGAVVAFRYERFNKSRTGIMVMDGPSEFLVAVNLYEEEGRQWTMDQLPSDNIILFEATREETVWGLEYFLLFEYGGFAENYAPIVNFINKESQNTILDEYDSRKFCLSMLEALPYFQSFNDKTWNKNDFWAIIRENVNAIGLQFNRAKVELYCYLMAILMITESPLDINKKRVLLELLYRNWESISWMYAFAIGRVVGCKHRNILSMVNGLGVVNRAKYLHLYLPLVEANIEKYGKYNTSDTPAKLQQAIKKMKTCEEQQRQVLDLDELYSILFPSHVQQAFNSNRPAATIQELNHELEVKNNQIQHWKKQAETLNHQLEEITDSMKTTIEKSLSMDDVSTAILDMNINLAITVYSNLDRKLANHPVWKNGRDILNQKINELERKYNEAALRPSVGENNGIMAGGNIGVNLSPDGENKLISMISEQKSLK